jgi:hypothetical protein
MKYFVISDVHSFYDEMLRSLSNAGFDLNNPEHMIIFCGDAFDRGPKSWAMWQWLVQLKKLNKLVYIRGNHEWLLQDLIYRGYPSEYDNDNGTIGTVCQLATADVTTCMDTLPMSFADACESCKPINKWINENSVLYYEVGRYVFVHSWIPTFNLDNKPYYFIKERKFGYNKDWRNATPNDFMEASWGCPVKMYAAGLTEPGKTIVCGHWHASAFHNALELHVSDMFDFRPAANFGIFRSKDDLLVGIDACTAWTGKVNVLVISDAEKGPNDPVNLTEDSRKEIHAKFYN